MEAGKYQGHIVQSKVDTTRNGCVQFVAVLRLTRCEGVDLPAPYTPTAYMSLTKNDGSRNISQVDSLMAALGWDGVSLKKLHLTDWSSREIEAVIDWDEFNGTRKLKVKWLNAPGSVPTLKSTDPKLIDELEAFWGGGKRPAPRQAQPAPAAARSLVDDIPEEDIPF
jgi:hypothetical protein